MFRSTLATSFALLCALIVSIQDGRAFDKKKAGPDRPDPADLAAVSITHTVRWIDLPGPLKIRKDVVVGMVKNVSKRRYVGDCTITLSQGTLEQDPDFLVIDENRIKPNPQVLKRTVLKSLAAGATYSLRADVPVNYWDRKTIFILEISRWGGDSNLGNNKITKQFERPADR